MKQAKKFLKKIDFWKIITFVLIAFLAVSLATDAQGLNLLRKSQIEEQVQPSLNPLEIYKKLVCACCGKSIADCTCGMAKERRAFVDEQVEKNLNEKGVYKEAIKKYGEEILFDTVLAAELKDELRSEAPKDRPIISFELESVDLGEISMARGNVETIFKMKNVGETNLELTSMESSCMCTTAILKNGEETSPVFGMHDNPTDWLTLLEPGEEANLVIIFDPNAHGPEGTGPITRTVTVFSNDPIDSLKKVQIEGEVVN